MKIETGAVKDARGHKTGQVFASFCDISAAGTSVVEAKSALMERLAQAVRALQHGYIQCGDGTMLIVRWYGEVWGYDILGGSHMERGFPSACMGYPSYYEAEEGAKRHATQCFDGVVGSARG